MYKITLTGYRDPISGMSWIIWIHTVMWWRLQTTQSLHMNFEKLKNENKGNILGQYIEAGGVSGRQLEYQALCEGVRALMETRRG